MQVQAYIGYWENERFYPVEKPLHKPGRQKAILTFIEETLLEPIQQEEVTATIPSEFMPLVAKIGVEAAQRRINWLNRLEASVQSSADEELVYIPRSKEMRPPLNFGD